LSNDSPVPVKRAGRPARARERERAKEERKESGAYGRCRSIGADGDPPAEKPQRACDQIGGMLVGGRQLKDVLTFFSRVARPQDFFTAPEILVEIGDFFASCDLQFVGFEENELEETHPIENYEQVRRWFLNL